MQVRALVKWRSSRHSPSADERFRALFIVPSVPLVDQQTRAIVDQVGHKMEVGALLASAHCESRTMRVLRKNVTVMTAQIAVNLLLHTPHDALLW